MHDCGTARGGLLERRLTIYMVYTAFSYTYTSAYMLAPLTPGTNYVTPQKGDINPDCECNTVMYSYVQDLVSSTVQEYYIQQLISSLHGLSECNLRDVRISFVYVHYALTFFVAGVSMKSSAAR